MRFIVETNVNEYELQINPERIFVIGYSGSNVEKIMEHIKELEEKLGVKPPEKIPTIFEVSREIVTQNTDLFFVGNKTSGECEYVIIKKDDKYYIGLGSDHTDRELESYSITKAKQVSLKPISDKVWEYDEIKNHMNSIKLFSDYDGVRYQEGTLADIISVEQIMKELNDRVGEIGDCIIYSGTVPLVDDYRYGSKFFMELNDEELDRKITKEYYINIIPSNAR